MNTVIIDEAHRLLTLGFTPIPACAPAADGSCTVHDGSHSPKDAGKVPLVAGYPAFATSPPAAAECLGFFVRPYAVNIGMVIATGMWVVDTDSPEADAEVAALLPPALATPTRLARPSRGRCWVFAAPPGVVLASSTRRGNSHAVDILGPGKFFILPPSLTASGYLHAWSPGLAPWQVPVAPMPLGLAERVATWTAKAPSTGSKRGPLPPGVVPTLCAPPQRDVVAAMKVVQARSSLRRLFDGRKEHGDTSQSGVDFSFALEALRSSLKPEVVAQLLRQRRGVHRDTDEYIERTVNNALRALGKRP